LHFHDAIKAHLIATGFHSPNTHHYPLTGNGDFSSPPSHEAHHEQGRAKKANDEPRHFDGAWLHKVVIKACRNGSARANSDDDEWKQQCSSVAAHLHHDVLVATKLFLL